MGRGCEEVGKGGWRAGFLRHSIVCMLPVITSCITKLVRVRNTIGNLGSQAGSRITR